MESLVAALGNYPLLQIVGAAAVIVAGLLAMRKGAKDSGKEPLPLTEADLLRLEKKINDEQSAARRLIYESIAADHNKFEGRVSDLIQRVAVLEALGGKHR